MKKVSNSNTKAEILQAYDQLLNQLKKERSQNSALQRELEQKKQLVVKAEEQTKEGGATQSIQLIRKTLNEQLDKIELGLSNEQQKFEELQQAIKIEQETLEELYKIKAQAESLDALLITHKRAKDKLEEETDSLKIKLKEEIEATKISWKREQESYEYDLKIERRNEEDSYNQRKAQQEKELKEQKLEFEKNVKIRENILAEQEEEFKRLQKEVAQFEGRLQKSIQAAEKTISDQLTKEFDYRQKLETKDLQAQLQLSKQQIESLQQKVAEQQELIKTLSSKTDNATLQVKDIALKAIENAGIRSLTFPGMERGKEEKE
ncbi:MAG TPA: hypothetical protein ENK52_04905 [Saprospiraceae bacterium]|nr:hypothetical protein [Saprospiraceae bacterium]